MLYKKALVLGAGGFIGGHLIISLVNDGYKVYGADLKFPEFRGTVAYKFFKGDLTNNNFVEEIFNIEPTGFDEVYQLAADMGGATYINCGTHDADVVSNSVMINVNITRACVKFQAKRLFFSSSACVYPATSKDSATCCEKDVYPAEPDNEYGWEKLFTERMLKSYQRQYGLVVRIARFHSIVGDYSTWRGGREKAHSALARKVAMAEENGTIDIIGDGKQLRTFLYVSDCIIGIRKLMASDCDEIVNIGSDEIISIYDYVQLLIKISGKNLNTRFISGPTGIKERQCDLTKVKSCINWQPSVSLEIATKITYEWIINELKKRQNILYISQKIGYSNNEKYHCGIGIRGKLNSDILKKSDKYNFIQCFIDNTIDLEELVQKYLPKVIFYNYHSTTTPWITNDILRQKYLNIVHIMIHYDMHQHLIDTFNPNNFANFNYILTDDDTLKGRDNIFIVPRSIPMNDLFTEDYQVTNSNIPKIGFQGFAVPHKGIPRIARQVQDEFDDAILRFHIPFSYYSDQSGDIVRHILNEVYSIITKPNIKIEVSHEFLTDEEIIRWLHENTINCYFNDYLDGSGIASSPDYAIAARKPIAITRSHQFRHMWDLSPSIMIEHNSLKTIIKNGIFPLKKLYDKYTHEKVIQAYENICDKFVTNQ